MPRGIIEALEALKALSAKVLEAREARCVGGSEYNFCTNDLPNIYTQYISFGGFSYKNEFEFVQK